MVDIVRSLWFRTSIAAKRSNNRASRPARQSTIQRFCRHCHFAVRLRFSTILAMLEIDLRRERLAMWVRSQPARGSANQKGRPDWPFSSH
jgi:glutaredoxin